MLALKPLTAVRKPIIPPHLLLQPLRGLRVLGIRLGAQGVRDGGGAGALLGQRGLGAAGRRRQHSARRWREGGARR